MQITDNFVLAIRANYLSHSRDGEFSAWRYHPRESTVWIAREHFSLKTEREVWELLAARKPQWLDELNSDESSIYWRGMGRRGELILRSSPAEMERLESEFSAQMMVIHTVIMEALGATVASRKVTPRRIGSRQGILFWNIAAKVFFPHLSHPDPVPVTVKLFPSPIKDSTWSVRIQMAAPTPELLQRNQALIQDAFSALAARGIGVEDVLQGSWMEA